MIPDPARLTRPGDETDGGGEKMLKRVAQVLGLVVVLPLLAYLLLWPTPIAPQAWTPPKA